MDGKGIERFLADTIYKKHGLQPLQNGGEKPIGK